MVKRLLAVLCIVVILGACSKSSEFDKYMRSGKDALIQEQFDEAIKQFQLALIESPRDKDAAILLDQARNGFEEKQAGDLSSTYRNDIMVEYNKFLEVYQKYDEKYINDKEDNVISLHEMNDIEKLDIIFDSVNNIGKKYESNKIIHDINASLSSAISGLRDRLRNEGGGLYRLAIKDKVASFTERLDKLSGK